MFLPQPFDRIISILTLLVLACAAVGLLVQLVLFAADAILP